MADFSREVVEGTRLARRAIDLGRDDAVALAAGGFSLAYLDGDLDAGATFIDRAIALNPNFGGTWHASGWVRIYLGEPDLAIDHLAHAMRLSPLDPLTFQMAAATALAHFFAGRDDASLEAGKVLREIPNFVPALRIYAASCAMAGRLAEAQKASARAHELAPALRVSNVKNMIPLRRPEDLARLTDGLRKAGLPV
jgi:tetratricopeptide (TPR) repeat protein